jgi:hypothetical protein
MVCAGFQLGAVEGKEYVRLVSKRVCKLNEFVSFFFFFVGHPQGMAVGAFVPWIR